MQNENHHENEIEIGIEVTTRTLSFSAQVKAIDLAGIPAKAPIVLPHRVPRIHGLLNAETVEEMSEEMNAEMIGETNGETNEEKTSIRIYHPRV